MSICWKAKKIYNPHVYYKTHFECPIGRDSKLRRL